MTVLITACTEKAFSRELLPLAHLTFGEVCAVNDNKRQRLVRTVIYPRQQLRSHCARRPAELFGQRRNPKSHHA
jgi:hypothetical protein